MSRRGQEKSYTFRSALVCLAGVVGLLLLGVAIYMPIKAGDAREHAQRIAGLPDVHSGTIGDTVTVSGTIANETPLLRGDFVAYRRQQVKGGYRAGTETVTVDSGKQPLVIDTSGGRVRIVNNDYRFEDKHVDWAAAEAVDTPTTFTEAMIKILGFKRSSPVVAVGVVTRVGDAVSVKAEFVVAGPRDAYVANLGNASESPVGTALVLAAVGALLLLYAFWDGRRIYRS